MDEYDFKLFVYGTLKKDQPNFHHFLNEKNGQAKFYANAITCDSYPLVLGPISNSPYLLKQTGIGKNILGEIYQINSKMLEFCDTLERHPFIYHRELIKVTILSTTTTTNQNDEQLPNQIEWVWSYLFPDFHPDLLNSTFLDFYDCNNDFVKSRPYVPLHLRPKIDMIPLIKSPQRREYYYDILVYGTLKSGEPNHDHMSEKYGKSIKIGKGRTQHAYPFVIAGKCNLPFLLNCKGTGMPIEGEIYEVDSILLSHLDEFEDHPTIYQRHLVPVNLLNDDNVVVECRPCWIYFLENYPPEMLALPFISCYQSAGSHGRPYRKELDDENAYDFLAQNIPQ